MGSKIGFCIGVFDCFHVGHLRLIQRAAKEVDHLIVAVVKDAAVKKQKGDTRPIIPFEQRYEIIAHLNGPAEVVASEDFDPYKVVADAVKRHGKVDLFIKGEDQHHIPTEKVEQDFNIQILTLHRTPNISTTQIQEKLK